MAQRWKNLFQIQKIFAGEKHVPVITKIDECRVKVEVGSVAHPMLPEHHIAFIYVETENGGIRVDLKDKPEAEFCICADKPIRRI